MPTMYEIYDKHADWYDAMVQAEDYQANLKKLLWDQVEWSESTVLEAGVGTGRVTKVYVDQAISAICCDRSTHMLEFAKRALSAYRKKLDFHVVDNLDFPTFEADFDVFIEGWSFGHSIMDCATPDEVTSRAHLLVEQATKNIRPGGQLIFIETLGTNEVMAAPPTEKLEQFYTLLEADFRFQKHVVRTDLKYQSLEEATRLLGFFFGDEMADRVAQRGSAIIPEWTGVWIKKI